MALGSISCLKAHPVLAGAIIDHNVGGLPVAISRFQCSCYCQPSPAVAAAAAAPRCPPQVTDKKKSYQKHQQSLPATSLPWAERDSLKFGIELSKKCSGHVSERISTKHAGIPSLTFRHLIFVLFLFLIFF
jgi:hypothetical protein